MGLWDGCGKKDGNQHIVVHRENQIFFLFFSFLFFFSLISFIRCLIASKRSFMMRRLSVFHFRYCASSSFTRIRLLLLAALASFSSREQHTLLRVTVFTFGVETCFASSEEGTGVEGIDNEGEGVVRGRGDNAVFCVAFFTEVKLSMTSVHEMLPVSTIRPPSR